MAMGDDGAGTKRLGWFGRVRWAEMRCLQREIEFYRVCCGIRMKMSNRR